MIYLILFNTLLYTGLAWIFHVIRSRRIDHANTQISDALRVIRFQQNINARLISQARRQDALIEGYAALNRGQQRRIQALTPNRDGRGRFI